MLRAYAAAMRGLAEGEVLAPKLHVLRINPDAFVADDGTKVGALFYTTGDKAKDAQLRLRPTKAFKAAIKRLVDRLIALCDAQADDAWFAARPELTVEYFRYDGCARDGTDPNGAVAAAHAARKADAADDAAPPPAAAAARKAALKAAAVSRKRKAAAATAAPAGPSTAGPSSADADDDAC